MCYNVRSHENDFSVNIKHFKNSWQNLLLIAVADFVISAIKKDNKLIYLKLNIEEK